ncbi:hypothetical protein F8M41_021914 [Gigaspora margarita]|uniref:Uncharacterized protein n=1 Tax=Gigaspora margarita TaxID=4874 RepID=A0A8H4B1D8_GIGMA|nr:hypothetical protein F8M41_021914 [Gigaspora margarita]
MLLKTEISMDKRSLDILVLGGDDLSDMSESFKPLPAIRKYTGSEQFRQLLINDGISVSSHGVHLCAGYITVNYDKYVKSER